ncbi:hypothetical protein PHEL49_2252 [Polaribacter sp. Hel1_33_49]|jgi:hypothetical protein|nr:hypothetical protein PHEL49_2252 [Polaribacter sp. Hel1_33_49]
MFDFKGAIYENLKKNNESLMVYKFNSKKEYLCKTITF